MLKSIFISFLLLTCFNFTTYTETIYDTIPEGVSIQECTHGHGLFATKSYGSGDVIYKHRYIVVEPADKYYLLVTDIGDFTLKTSIHSVDIGNNQRALYTFDSFMNHSCDPNSRSFATPEMIKNFDYYQIATKDIKIGDQITCDYNLFEYDCTDKNIENCNCGAACRKSVKGFKWLSLSDQASLFPLVDSHITHRFLQDNPDYIYIDDLKIPSSVSIVKNGDFGKIVSNNAYNAGDVIYENDTLIFKDNQTIIANLNGKGVLVNNTKHTVRRENSEREFYYFDSFMNHSCDPNTITSYLSPNHYQGIALRSIEAGEELTCDYGVFDDNPDGEGFKCACGAENCKGWVY